MPPAEDSLIMRQKSVPRIWNSRFLVKKFVSSDRSYRFPLLVSNSIISALPFHPIPRFFCKQNGVLFENDLLQIGIKAEYRQNLARVGVFFGNKTTFQFTNFTSNLVLADSIKSGWLTNESLWRRA